MIAVIATPLPVCPCGHRQIGERCVKSLSCVNALELPLLVAFFLAAFVSGGV